MTDAKLQKPNLTTGHFFVKELTANAFSFHTFGGMEKDDLTYTLALANVFNFNCSVGRKLMEFCGGAEEVFKMGGNAILELMPKYEMLVNRIFEDSLLRWAEDERNWAQTYGVKLIPYENAVYPKRMLECDDAPILLYCLGDADLNADRMLSVVGTRKATYYGKNVCNAIIEALGQNPHPPTIVSGLAYGIDGEAHRAALNAGIPTVAVLPTGLDCIYPTGHRDLAKLIINGGGALLTDFSRNAAVTKNQFLRRNRIIAGISDATLLVESFEKGGGLITTDFANSYNREVFAVPGRTVDPSFDGCNKLIENNLARLATGAASIERAMGWRFKARKKKTIPELEFEDDPVVASVVSFLAERSPVRFNAILDCASKPGGGRFQMQELSSILLDLELCGRLGVSGGDLYELIR